MQRYLLQLRQKPYLYNLQQLQCYMRLVMSSSRFPRHIEQAQTTCLSGSEVAVVKLLARSESAGGSGHLARWWGYQRLKARPEKCGWRACGVCTEPVWSLRIDFSRQTTSINMFVTGRFFSRMGKMPTTRCDHIYWEASCRPCR